jgi:hypothetical protein
MYDLGTGRISNILKKSPAGTQWIYPEHNSKYFFFSLEIVRIIYCIASKGPHGAAS